MSKKLRIGFLIFLVLFGVGLYFSYDWYQGKKEEQAISADYKNVFTDSSYARLLFLKGGEPGKKESVAFLKNKIAETNYNNVKALFINQLLSFYYSDFDSNVYKEIFSDGPLLKFKKENEKDSLLALATESNLLYPTSFALMKMSAWHANQILDENLTTEEKQKEADQILIYLADAEKLFFEKETAETFLKIFGAQTAFGYYHFKSIMLGAVSIVYPSHQKEMDESFQKTIVLHEKESENLYSLISFPYTRFYYASFLSELEGDSRQSDIDREVKILISALEKDPNLYKNGFISFARLQSDNPAQKRDHNYRWFSLLAKNYPDFKKFLSSYDISFE